MAVALIALLFFSAQFDWPIQLGPLTAYHNELLLAAALACLPLLLKKEARQDAKIFAVYFLPLGLWLLLHGLHPGPLWEGVKAAARAAQFALGLALPLLLLRKGAELDRAIDIAAACVGLTAAWALAQSLAGPESLLNAGRGVELINGFQAGAAGFGHHNQLGAFMAAAACLFAAAWLSGKKRPPLAWGFLAALVGLASSYSRGAWMGAALGLLFLVPLMSSRARYAAAFAAVLGALLAAFGPFEALRARVLSLGSDGDRMAQLRASWGLWEGHAFWGWGPALQEQVKAVAEALPLEAASRLSFASHLHNTYLQIGLTWGAPALLLWLAFLFLPFSRALDALKRLAGRPWALGLLGAMAAFGLQAATDHLLLHARGLAVSLCWGLALAALRLQESKRA